MKFGCCVGVDKYDVLEKIGYDFIELAGSEIYKMNKEEFKYVKQKIKNGIIVCSSLNAFLPSNLKFIGDRVDKSEISNYLDTVIYRAGVIGVKTIGIGSPHSRIIPRGFPLKTALQQLVDFIETVARRSEKYGIRVLLEPLNRYETNFINTTVEALDILKEIKNQNVGILLDLYHFIVEKEDVNNLNSELARYIYHVHIADEDGRTYLKAYKYMKYKKIIERLKMLGYDGGISIEANYENFFEEASKSLQILKTISK